MRKVGSRIAITLTLIAMTRTVSSQQVKRSTGSDGPRIQRAAPADANTLATRQRFLEMFARAYFPGRTGQLLIVPREGDFKDGVGYDSQKLFDSVRGRYGQY